MSGTDPVTVQARLRLRTASSSDACGLRPTISARAAGRSRNTSGQISSIRKAMPSVLAGLSITPVNTIVPPSGVTGGAASAGAMAKYSRSTPVSIASIPPWP